MLLVLFFIFYHFERRNNVKSILRIITCDRKGDIWISFAQQYSSHTNGEFLKSSGLYKSITV